MENNYNILALDVGGRRLGMAIAHGAVRLPRPLTTLTVDDTILAKIEQVVKEEQVGFVIIGLPRNLQGDDTKQTQAVRTFAAQLQAQLPDVAITWQDEALTSQKAETELIKRGKVFAKGDIDALAATYILEDYLRDHPAEVRV